MAVTKGCVDAMATGITWRPFKPANPVSGDCYFDPASNVGYIWQGSAWITFSGSSEPEPEPFDPPTAEQLENHPSLRAAWEEFLVIKRLLGV